MSAAPATLARMFTTEEVAAAVATMPIEPLTEAHIRRLIAARPEATLDERVASAAYLDALSAQEAAQWNGATRVARMKQWRAAQKVLEAEAA